MEYTKKFFELKSIYDISVREILIPDSEMSIRNLEFISGCSPKGIYNKEDLLISENKSFSYPVFIPPCKDSTKVILLLHGLNERSWVKYLTWAYYLCQNTGSYVILFPISFHINRSPSSWIDPRVMIGSVKERTMNWSDVKMSTFANIALSNRLSQDPMRFFNSGYQTAFDIVKLMTQIKNGEHEVIPQGCRVNIFAYSIGAFLSQILVMGNPENLFSSSKLFLFCGGSVFSNMHGTSKLIMDSVAFKKIYSFYLDDFEKEIKRKNSIYGYISESQIGMAFRSMIDFSRFKSFRESFLGKVKDQVRSIALLKDAVIPSEGILKTMNYSAASKDSQVEVWDFPYQYSHENPFPVFDNPDKRNVDSWFDRLFSEACLFFA
jgi:hypothetical protein